MPKSWRLRSSLSSLWHLVKGMAFWIDNQDPLEQLTRVLLPPSKIDLLYWESILTVGLQSSHEARQHLLSHKILRLHIYKQWKHPQHEYVVTEVWTPKNKIIFYCLERSVRPKEGDSEDAGLGHDTGHPRVFFWQPVPVPVNTVPARVWLMFAVRGGRVMPSRCPHPHCTPFPPHNQLLVAAVGGAVVVVGLRCCLSLSSSSSLALLS